MRHEGGLTGGTLSGIPHGNSLGTEGSNSPPSARFGPECGATKSTMVSMSGC